VAAEAFWKKPALKNTINAKSIKKRFNVLAVKLLNEGCPYNCK
jgi:hypothetical protein